MADPRFSRAVLNPIVLYRGLVNNQALDNKIQYKSFNISFISLMALLQKKTEK